MIVIEKVCKIFNAPDRETSALRSYRRSSVVMDQSLVSAANRNDPLSSMGGEYSLSHASDRETYDMRPSRRPSVKLFRSRVLAVDRDDPHCRTYLLVFLILMPLPHILAMIPSLHHE